VLQRLEQARESQTNSRRIQINRSDKDPELGFNIRGGAEFGHPIFVSQVFENSKASDAGMRVCHHDYHIHDTGSVSLDTWMTNDSSIPHLSFF
jgi:hypothetical protein